MIRTAKALAEALARGATVTVQGTFDGGAVCGVVEGTGETVSRRAIDALERQEAVRVLDRDLAGNAYRWGAT